MKNDDKTRCRVWKPRIAKTMYATIRGRGNESGNEQMQKKRCNRKQARSVEV